MFGTKVLPVWDLLYHPSQNNKTCLRLIFYIYLIHSQVANNLYIKNYLCWKEMIIREIEITSVHWKWKHRSTIQ